MVASLRDHAASVSPALVTASAGVDSERGAREPVIAPVSIVRRAPNVPPARPNAATIR